MSTFLLTFLVTFIATFLVITAMSVGVMFKRRPIQGSCGGLGAVGLGGECEFCGGDPDKCEEQQSA